MNEEQKSILRLKSKQWRQRYKLNGPATHLSEKTCSRCKQLKPITEFALCKTNSDWRATKCRVCAVLAMKEWRKRNPDRAKEHSLIQYERSKTKPDDIRLKYSRRYNATHKAVQARRTAEWKSKNRAKFNAYMLAYHKRRMDSDPNYAFAYKIRCKIRLLLRGHCKSAPTERLLGCKIGTFKLHIESLWEPWMSWENYGNGSGKWCIDHKIPVIAFNLDDPLDQQACFHFTNQRPLSCEKNREKWDKFDPAELEALRASINHEAHRIQDAQRLHASRRHRDGRAVR